MERNTESSDSSSDSEPQEIDDGVAKEFCLGVIDCQDVRILVAINHRPWSLRPFFRSSGRSISVDVIRPHLPDGWKKDYKFDVHDIKSFYPAPSIDAKNWLGFIFILSGQHVVRMREFESFLSDFEKQTLIRPGGAKPVVR
jgi:hypothetical protein